MNADTPPDSETLAAPVKTQTRWLPALRVEIDVTPRWFTTGPDFDADLLVILATWREAGGDLRRMMVDFQAGLSGVRFVLAVHAGISVDQIEAARLQLTGALDALDFMSPRRQATTQARTKARRGSPGKATGPSDGPRDVPGVENAVVAPPGPSNGHSHGTELPA